MTRERGTPHKLLKLYIVLPLILGIASAIGVALTYNLWQQTLLQQDSSNYAQSLVIVLSMVLSGTIASLMGILYGSMSVFSLSCGIAYGVASFVLLLVTYEGVLSLGDIFEMLKAAFAAAFPSVFAACILPILRKSNVLSKLQIPRDNLISRGVFLSCQVAAQTMVGGPKDGLTSDNVLLIALITSFGFFTLADITTVGLVFIGTVVMVVRSLMNFSLYGGEPFVLLIVAMIVMSILASFYKNHQHLSGSINFADTLSGIEIFSARASVVGMLHTLLNVSDKEVELLAFFGVMIGAFVMISLAIIFGAVGDCWEAVGSNQWQMTSVDTLGLLFHFVFPIVLLLYRACDKYNVLNMFQENLNSEFGSYSSMVLNASIIFSVVVGIGMPVLNSLSPISSYLFARSYLNGQPSTRKVAISVSFSDIFEETKNNPQLFKEFLLFLKQQKATLNVFAKFSDTKLQRDMLKELANDGHHIGISSYSHHYESGAIAFDKVLTVRDELAAITGVDPTWYTPVSGHRHPFALKACAKTSMRVCYWSTLCHTGIMNQDKCLEDIKRDVRAKGGGNIIFFTKGATNDHAWTSVISLIKQSIVYLNEIKFEARGLDEVVKDDQVLHLKHRERVS